MRNLSTILLVLFLVTFSNIANARLGETKEQLIARFGSEFTEIDFKPDYLTIQWEGMNEKVHKFAEMDKKKNICQKITYRFVSINSVEEVASQLPVIVANNSQGHKWSDFKKSPADQDRPTKLPKGTWERSDGGEAEWDGYELIIWSSEYFEINKRRQDSKKQEREKEFKGAYDNL